MGIILILSTTKKTAELSFCSRFKICLNGFKVIRPIIFCSQESKFSTVKKTFHKKFDQENFPKNIWSRKFPLVKEFFYKKKIHQEYVPEKGSVKAKILDPFNTKSHAKIFLAL